MIISNQRTFGLFGSECLLFLLVSAEKCVILLPVSSKFLPCLQASLRFGSGWDCFQWPLSAVRSCICCYSVIIECAFIIFCCKDEKNM